MLDWDLNWIAVIVAIVAHQALGALWYGPLFSTKWLVAMGKTRDAVGNPGPALVVGLLGSIVAAVGLALLINLGDDPDLGLGLTVGALAAVAFVATTLTTQGAYEERPNVLTWLFIMYQLVGFMIMGAILGAWR